MIGKHKAKASTEPAVRDLLERYACPVPLHIVRTRFLGSIATPVMAVSSPPILPALPHGAFRLTKPYRLMADVDPALEQQILNVAKRKRKADVHHHHQPDHLGR